jgi:hypothetical protein
LFLARSVQLLNGSYPLFAEPGNTERLMCGIDANYSLSRRSDGEGS